MKKLTERSGTRRPIDTGPAGTDEDFVRLVTGCQSRLYAYILSLVCDRDRASDILQETNVVLWRKANEFRRGSRFEAWATRVAYFQVLANRQQRSRERMVFDHGLLETIAQESAVQSERFDERQRCLRRCLEKLNRRQRALLERRYADGSSVKDIAAELGQSAGRVASRLFRIRRRLLECIECSMEDDEVEGDAAS